MIYAQLWMAGPEYTTMDGSAFTPKAPLRGLFVAILRQRMDALADCSWILINKPSHKPDFEPYQ